MLNCVLSVGRIKINNCHSVCPLLYKLQGYIYSLFVSFFFQSYVVCELPEKLNFLYSFIRNHIKSKILVFVSSCKQVRV